jgi:succinoglycan biosynthesis transport protein ExoP
MEKKLFLTTLKNKKWLVVCIPLVAGLVAYFLMGTLQKKYKSSAQVSIVFPVGDKKVSAQEAEMEILSHVEAMKTEFIGLMVSYRLLMHDLNGSPFRKNNFTVLPDERRNAANKLRDKLDSFDILSPYNNSEYKLMDAIDRKDYHVVADKKLRVGRVGHTNFISVEFTSENPALSAFVVNTLCSEYIRYTTYSNRYPFDSLNFLGRLMEKRKDEWRAKADLLNNYRADNVKNTERLALREKYQNQLDEEEEKLTVSASSLKDINDRITAQRSILGENQNSNIRNTPKVTQLQTKINELSKVYTDQGSKDRDLATTINGLRKQLQTELTRLEQTNNTGKRNQLDQLLKEKSKIDSNHAVITSNLNAIKDRLSKVKFVNGAFQKESIDALEHEYDKSLREYIFVRNKYEKARIRIQSLGPIPELKVVVMGSPNFKAESVDMVLIIGSVIIGTVVIVVIAIALSHFHRPRVPVDPSFVILR